MAQKHLVVPDTVESAIRVAVAGINARVVIHHLVPAGASVTPTAADTLFNSLKTLWQTQLAPLCPSTTILGGVEMRDLRQSGMPLVLSTVPGVPGTAAAGEALPRQIAACLTVRTDRAGRKYRGRMYWAGFAESANGSDNHMGTATKTALDAFASGFLSAVNVSGWQFGVTHRPTLFDEGTGLPIAPGLGFTTIATQVSCRDNVWDSQRRRAG